MPPVEMVQETFDAPKETKEVKDALVAIVKVTKEALADGWQAGTDLPAIITVAAAHLLTAVDGMNKIPMEYNEARGGFIKTLGVGMGDIADALLPPVAPPAE